MAAARSGPIGQLPVPPDLPRSVLDNLLEGCQVVGADYRYLYVNAAAAHHGRSAPEALVGRTMMEAYPGIDATEMFGVLRRCMEERASARMVNEFAFPDGSQGWFELRFEPVPEGVVILSIDVTELERAKLALRRSMRALATLSRSNQALVHAVDEGSLVDEVTRIVVETGGYAAAWIGLLEPDGALAGVARAGLEGGSEAGVAAWEAGTTALAGRAVGTGRIEVVLFSERDPAPGSWEAHALQRGLARCVALPVAKGDVVLGALVIHASDANAFDQAEVELLSEVALDLGYGLDALRTRRAREETVAQLEEVRTRIRTIYDHLPHAALVWRAANGKGFTVIDFNRAAQSLADALGAAQRGAAASELEPVVPHLGEDLERCSRERTQRDREVECALPGGPLRMALTYGFVPPDMVVLHAQDVTRERQAEEQLAGAQRLEAVARLAGGVAHDFNNILSIVLTSAEFALARLDASDPARNDVEQVREAAERAAALTKQLLAFGRRQMLEPTVTSFDDVVDGLAGVIRSALGEDIDLELHPADEPGHVMVDPGQLERVLVNLALNARDAMSRGGKVTIETANVDLDAEYVQSRGVVRPGPYVCLSVTDTGIGMPEHVRERVFEPFFTTKGEGKGTGLGLASVYGIVKQSGGYIWVYSEPGRGTTFKIYLPRVDEAPPEPEPREARKGASTGHETILVVEDEEGVRRASERILAGAGYRVLAAAGGRTALALCEEHGANIDLLLTDVIMPEMSGPDLAEQVRRSWPHVKILFMSGYAPQAISHHGLLDAGTQLVEKPFSVEALRRKVREVLDEQ
jgi:signal transduction histidine kinase